eukprot:COSAG03_NODE_13567_length_497_cov_2.216080_1_plen_99_part_10
MKPTSLVRLTHGIRRGDVFVSFNQTIRVCLFDEAPVGLLVVDAARAAFLQPVYAHVDFAAGYERRDLRVGPGGHESVPVTLGLDANVTSHRLHLHLRPR